MPHHCTRCGINWSRLWTIDSDSEDYDVCPECMVDNHLQQSEDPDTYFKCRFRGKVYSTRTGKQRVEKIPEPPPFNPKKYWRRRWLKIAPRNY